MREDDRTDLDALAAARPAALDPANLAGSRRQHDDLVMVLSTDPAADRHARRVSSRRRVWPVVVPVVGVAAVAAVVVGTLPGGSSGPAPAQPHTSSPQASGPDAHVVLLNMATAIQNQTGQGNYWQVTTDSGNTWIAGTAPDQYAINETSSEIWSIGVLSGEQSLMVMGVNENTQPRTTKDRARWQAAGSPTSVRIDPGVAKGGGEQEKLGVTIGAGHESVLHTNDGGDIVAVGGNNVNYAYLRNLPSDTAGLSTLLDQLYTQENGKEITGKTAWTLNQASNLITMPVSSAVRAAAYRIIAGLPGITSLGRVTDPLGRTGVGVALPVFEPGDLGTVREELIVDPTTNSLLSDQEVIVTPSALATSVGLTAGTPIIYTATTHTGWADQQINTPTTTG
jgi:hypothetical protein